MRHALLIAVMCTAGTAIGQIPSVYSLHDALGARSPFVPKQEVSNVPSDVLDELFLVSALENGAHAAMFRAKLIAASEVASENGLTDLRDTLLSMSRELPPPLKCFRDGLMPREGSRVPQDVWQMSQAHCDRPELKSLLERAAAYYGRYQESVGKTCQTEQLILLQERYFGETNCQPNVVQLRAALWQLRGTKNSLSGILEGQFGYFAKLKAHWSSATARELALSLRDEHGFTIDRLEREIPRKAAHWWLCVRDQVSADLKYDSIPETERERIILHHYLLFCVHVDSAADGYCGGNGLSASTAEELDLLTSKITRISAWYFSHFRPREQHRVQVGIASIKKSATLRPTPALAEPDSNCLWCN